MSFNSGLPEPICDIIRAACSYQETHSTLDVTYETLLLYVWQRVEASEHRDELIVILAEQIRASASVCSTGRISRLVAALAGFFDDVVIEISDSDRIQGIIAAVRTSLEPYSAQAHHDLVRARLIEFGYDTDTMQPWLDAILDD